VSRSFLDGPSADVPLMEARTAKINEAARVYERMLAQLEALLGFTARRSAESRRVPRRSDGRDPMLDPRSTLTPDSPRIRHR
jgi:hypothetical protein